MKLVKSKFNELNNVWIIDCIDGFLSMTCIHCLVHKYDINKNELTTLINNNIIHTSDYPLRMHFNSEEKANIVCDFINQYIILKKLSEG